ncbi:hypothetical protein ACQUJS_12840 [Ralstonia pseudosolanacearum]|uniref:HTH hxlR-type domain-containing protein n=1 Tax=Ralstonia solanacearum TaxID=305 RepID=A0A0S4TT66_RALSL|nr:hypothetical protein [Ralstonia pseudosolanacearum]CUV13259.1 protein of unknown function [Ralstonia solanacearum]
MFHQPCVEWPLILLPRHVENTAPRQSTKPPKEKPGSKARFPIGASLLTTFLRYAPASLNSPSAEYALTALGRELLPAIDILAAVGQKLMAAWENPPPQPERRPGNKKPAITKRLRGFLLRQARVSRRSSR